MNKGPIIKYIKHLPGPYFTTRDLARISGKSLSTVTQGLNSLCHHDAIIKISRGIWAERSAQSLSAFDLVPFLMPDRQAYVSFVSALHLHGMIEQIPQSISLATTAHTRTIRTSIAAFSLHRIAPEFFMGFDWYKSTGSFLIASPEKALLDCWYLSGRKSRNFAYFPELQVPKDFDYAKARQWAKRIPDPRLRAHVMGKLEDFESG